jgi:hypothetical protein
VAPASRRRLSIWMAGRKAAGETPAPQIVVIFFRCFMLNRPAPEARTGFRIYLLVSVGAFLFVSLYIGWVFYSRWETNQALSEKAAEKQRTQNQQSFEMMGGNRFEILGFLADPATIQAGEKSSLCYSLSNAKTAKIEPETEDPVWPAFNRCVHVSPRKTTTYALTIEDGAGHTKTATVEVKVQ